MTDTLVDTWIRRLKNRPFIAVLVVLAIVIVGVASVTESVEKVAGIFLPDKSQSKVLLSITLPDNVSVREAIDLVSQQRQASAHFDAHCSEELLGRRLNGGSISGKDVATVIMNLPVRLKERIPSFRLSVESKEQGRYDINCSV